MKWPYLIGCPVWTWKTWKGVVYPSSCGQQEFLKYYARQFLTVEGNTTFYAVPALETARRWAQQTPEGFQFSLKFPRSVTHEQKLVADGPDFRRFIEILQMLRQQERLGPTMIQLPPSFGSNQFADLVRFLRQLPTEFPFAVEVRHADYFQQPFESRLEEALRQHQMDRVIFDSRPLFSRPPADESERASQKRKPRPPVHPHAIGNRPILRLIGRNRIECVDPWIEEWVPRLSQWIAAGKQPLVFTHTPDDHFAPYLAHRFHQAMQDAQQTAGVKLPDLPTLRIPEQQQSLF